MKVLTHWSLGHLDAILRMQFPKLFYWLVHYDNALRWMSQDLKILADDESVLVLVMAWCCQPISHGLNHWWPRSPMWYDITRQQWVNIKIHFEMQQQSFTERHTPLVGLITTPYVSRTDSRFAPSQWETALLCNAISHWLGANLKSSLCQYL